MITPTLQHAIAEAIESRLLDVHVAMVCSVQTYNPATQRADLVPQIKRPLETLDTGEIDHEDLPVLPNVPIAFPRSANFLLSFPLEVGDFVLVVFNEYSIDQWLEKGRPTAPGDIGHLTMTGAIGIPIGPYPRSGVIAEMHPSDMVMGARLGTQVHVSPTGACEVTSFPATSADDWVAQAGKVLAELNKIKTALSTHVHAGVTTGEGTSGTAASVYTPASVASSNLKADD